MPILDIQQRFRELGRIRTGTTRTNDRGKRIPTKLPRFRLTTPWRHLLEHAAGVYGGTVAEWAHDGLTEFELVVDADALDVLVPPGVEVLSQWYERWSGGGLINRCDGIRQALVDQPCRCPKDPVERAKAATTNPPEACKPTTRLRVMLPAIPDLGIWRLETHGYHAAAELSGAAEFVELATRRGTLVPAKLVLHEREGSRRPNEPRKRFYVPALAFRDVLGATLDAMGYLDAGSTVPVYLPGVEPRPALNAGGSPALPPATATAGYEPLEPVEPAELPAPPPPPAAPAPPPQDVNRDRPAAAPAPSAAPIHPATVIEGPTAPPSTPEPAPFTPPEWEGEPGPATETGERSYSGPQLIAIKAEALGLDRDDRLLLVSWLVGRPVSTTKDLTFPEVSSVIRWLDEPTDDPRDLIAEARAEWLTEPDPEPAPPSDPALEAPFTEPAPTPPEPATLAPPPGPGSWGPDQWRAHCAAHRVKVTELAPALEALAARHGVDVPRKLDAITNAGPTFAGELAAWIEETGAQRGGPR